MWVGCGQSWAVLAVGAVDKLREGVPVAAGLGCAQSSMVG